MPRLRLDDRTYEHDDGIWTTIELDYCHPWENDAPADITVSIKTFERQEGRGFDFTKPTKEKFFSLDEMAAVMLHGFLGAASRLMATQWADYRAQMADEDKARTQGKAAA